MKRTGLLIMIVALTIFTLTSCGTILSLTDTTDPYLIEGTPEYERFTSDLIGTWEVTAMYQFGENSLRDIYEHVYLTISLNPMVCVFEFVPKDDVLARKTEQWSLQDADFSIKSYKRSIAWDEWQVAESGTDDFAYISFPYGAPSSSISATGSGKVFKQFLISESNTPKIPGFHYFPDRLLLEFIHEDSLHLFSYESPGVPHESREQLNLDILLKRVR